MSIVPVSLRPYASQVYDTAHCAKRTCPDLTHDTGVIQTQHKIVSGAKQVTDRIREDAWTVRYGEKQQQWSYVWADQVKCWTLNRFGLPEQDPQGIGVPFDVSSEDQHATGDTEFYRASQHCDKVVLSRPTSFAEF
jgi:hypothetical protein